MLRELDIVELRDHEAEIDDGADHRRRSVLVRLVGRRADVADVHPEVLGTRARSGEVRLSNLPLKRGCLTIRK
jgi:hypothetical protein